jgi:hypothetical protein
MSLTVIGIAGGAGTGKDYLVKHFLEPHGFKGAGFADHFKVELIGKGEMTWEEAFVTKPKWARDRLQARGTKEGREVYGENIWVDTLFADLRRIEMRYGLARFVVTDCRFPNEVEGVRAQGGKVYLIYAPERWAANGMDDEQRAHPSEVFGREPLAHVHRFDGVIENDPADMASVPQQMAALLAHAGVPMLINANVRLGIVDATGASLSTGRVIPCFGATSTPPGDGTNHG